MFQFVPGPKIFPIRIKHCYCACGTGCCGYIGLPDEGVEAKASFEVAAAVGPRAIAFYWGEPSHAPAAEFLRLCRPTSYSPSGSFPALLIPTTAMAL